jgi:hypothetical protein
LLSLWQIVGLVILIYQIYLILSKRNKKPEALNSNSPGNIRAKGLTKAYQPRKVVE